ncbi:hypothetical protein [Microbacterium schleiferi]|uniref:Uncharacterized protein n=1 Tax=Microbacterium schleiferi TaxID=69362 RepID=A0ABU7V5S6_9MICO
MSDSSRSASPAQVARSIQRTVAIAVAAVLASAAFAGILPGSTIFLGLLNADPPLTLARIVLVAVLLGGLRRPPSSLSTRLRIVAIVTGVFAAIAVIDPHGFGLLSHGVRPPEVAASVALSGVCLATSLVDSRR